MKENHKELITEIREVLSAYEMPYEEGAWETFIKPTQKKRIVLWPWISVAATLILVGALWLINKQPLSTTELDKPAHSTAKNNTKEQKEAHEHTSESTFDARKNRIQGSSATVLENGINGRKKDIYHVIPVDSISQKSPLINTIIQPDATALLINPIQTTVVAVDQEAIFLNPPAVLFKANGSMGLPARTKLNGLAIKLPGLKKIIIDTNIKVDESGKDKFMDFLNQERKTQVAKTTPKVTKKTTGSKWDFGVEVLPTVTSSAVNVGAGLLTAYKLSDHFSLGTGVAYTGLGSAVAHKPGISALDSKQLQSVNSSYRAIDIPLNLVYNVNKKIYTSVGVSYVNVVEEKATNTFISEQRSVSFDPAASSYTAGLVTQTTQETAQIQTLKGMGSLGFFNFSVGRKQEVFNKYHISIEPFIKVPVGKLSQQDLKLTNGGMKFKIEF